MHGLELNGRIDHGLNEDARDVNMELDILSRQVSGFRGEMYL